MSEHIEPGDIVVDLKVHVSCGSETKARAIYEHQREGLQRMLEGGADVRDIIAWIYGRGPVGDGINVEIVCDDGRRDSVFHSGGKEPARQGSGSVDLSDYLDD